MLETIADIDGTTPQSIHSAIFHFRRDIIKFRAEPGQDEGGLPPKDFFDLAEGAHATWRAAVEKVLTDADDQKRYWEDAHIPHTERGSFVLPLVSPRLVDNEQLKLWGGKSQMPYRLVTHRFQQNMRGTRSILDAVIKGDASPIEQAKDRDITHQLFDGLLKAVQPFERIDCHIVECPLPRRPRRPATTYTFGFDDVPPLKEAIKKLKMPEYPDAQKAMPISGFLQEFKHVKDSGKRQATMKGYLPGLEGPQTFNILLDKPGYALAFQLHEQEEQVDINGNLERAGVQTWTVHDARIRRSNVKEGWNEGGV